MKFSIKETYNKMRVIIFRGLKFHRGEVQKNRPINITQRPFDRFNLVTYQNLLITNPI